jgi:signal transduction histidine kinase
VSSEVVRIPLDFDKIRRVVTNLLSNAVKFTPSGGKVTVSADICEDVPAGESRLDIFQPERNRFLRLRVTDSGIGIPEDKIDQIFEAFYQVDNSSTRHVGGTGLGLAIVRNFVGAHGGRVGVESKVGTGSTFTIKLPFLAESVVGAAGVDGLATGT